MKGIPNLTFKLFYCYAREDKALRDQLEFNLRGLIRFIGPQGYRLTHWHDREILPGEEWEQVIDQRLDTADIILLLISPRFMASSYGYGREMRRALERHRTENCYVIPVLLRPTHWEGSPFSALQVLPTNSKPITSWTNRDAAFYDVVKGVDSILQHLVDLHKTKEEWLKEGNAYYNLRHFDDALAAYEQAIRLDPNDAVTHNNRGNQLRLLQRYKEALVAYEQAIRLDPNCAIAYNGKGFTLYNLERYGEALAVYEQAIRLDPNYGRAYYNKGLALQKLGKAMEALQAFEAAHQLDYNG